MENFEAVWGKSETVPGSFTPTNGRHLWEAAVQSPGIVVEVGVDQGRSASVLMAVAKETGAKVILVDSWPSVLVDNRDRVLALTTEFPGVNVEVLHMTSEEAAKQVPDGISMVHIDANHWDDWPRRDCAAWLPKLRSGGIACFHDYNVPAMHETVKAAVDEACAGWEHLGDWEGLAIRRKP